MSWLQLVGTALQCMLDSPCNHGSLARTVALYGSSKSSKA